ncbi:hypothetical protein CYR81_06975 [Enterococcus faecalis]|uniref:hypothetical protein n=1 Tax=Enterococcus faecalis TaxID=1351 RepID=UPI000C78FE0F|nr:hypothetical protein [Enterococcus faecalis]PLA80867.1 hypothetical protein CYR81_06975 [Enterococcus faecalis]
MDPFDEIVIKNYLSFPLVLQKLLSIKKLRRIEFFSQNMTTHIVFDGSEMITKGFRPDKEVEKLLLKLELIDKRIKRTTFRQKHFKRFWATLEPLEKQLLIDRFRDKKEVDCSHELIERVLDEIKEIETAICFMENIELEDENELSDDVEENLERMCDFFAL